ncbi:MAG: Hsp70 family protein [Acidobacteria bacterium]|nr:Hsp70 family protein [Acidobacteriota bacterium]
MRLGVDFGTTRIVVAACDRGNYPVVTFENPDGDACDWFPPLVGVRGSELVYGWDAWAAQDSPDATVVRSLKRYLSEAGPQTPIEIGGVRASVSAVLAGLAAALMRALRTGSNLEIAEGEVVEVMAGVPAGANSNQRFLTVEALRQAGFSVLGLLNEPSAASIEFGHAHREKSTKKDAILVYDLGGGTFDSTLVELDTRSHAVIASEGISTLGGDDFDHVLAEAALEAGGIGDKDSLTQAEWYRLFEEARRKKETLNPNSRRVGIDLDTVRAGWPQVQIPVAEFYARCEPLVAETFHAIDDLLARTVGVEAIYVTGGGSELPLVGRLLREKYKGKVRRSPYSRAATAIGLAIQADAASEYVLRDHFTRYFGVWREADGGSRMRFDPLFEKGAALPGPGDPPLMQTRDYLAVHNIGHYRYLECSHVSADGQPCGDITVWDAVYFPFDPNLRAASDLDALPVYHTWANHPIREQYRCGAGGDLQVSISNLGSGYERAYRLGRWGEKAPAIVPGKKKRAPAKRKKAGA